MKKPFHSRCNAIVKRIREIRKQLELVYKDLGEDDDLFQHQAKFADMTTGIMEVERDIERGKQKYLIDKILPDGEWVLVDEFGNEVECYDLTYGS